MAIEHQSSALPPAQPSYILRGHASQIHSVQFVRQNSRLLTGDADGWVVFWKVETKRALVVWKAHDGAMLGTAEWGNEKVITHGRDNRLRIWQLRPADESTLSTILPAEHAADRQTKPWLLHTLPVNTLNFCAFSACFEQPPHQTRSNAALGPAQDHSPSSTSNDSILVAVPARDDKKIEIYQFPEERLRYVVPRVQPTDTGMVMAVKLVQCPNSNNILVLAGYEGGVTAVHQLPQTKSSSLELAQLVYLSKPHSQPILSLDVSPDARVYFTSSADSIIAAHQIPELPADVGHNGDSSKNVQNEIVPSPLVTEENASAFIEPQLSQSKESPKVNTQDNPAPEAHPPLTFTKQPITSLSSPKKNPTSPTGLSSLLSTAPLLPKTTPPPPPLLKTTLQPPFKTTTTKHSGQQSLRVRSDGRLVATGGWDTRIRIYSAKTLREVAVLKWHKEGVYAVDFGTILQAGDIEERACTSGEGCGREIEEKEKTGTALSRVQKQREVHMQLKHWVVAGAKDGKVSLWEVF